MCRSAEFLDEGFEGWEGGAEAERESRAVASQVSGQCPLYLYFSSVAMSTAHCICTLDRWQCHRDLNCFW